MKPHYRYKGRYGGRMYWEARLPGDSRVEQVSCDWVWFWSPQRRAEVGLATPPEHREAP